MEVLLKILGLQADPDTSASFEISWPAVRKSVRDALIAGAVCAGVLLLNRAESADWSGTHWAWVWQVATTTGVVAAARRWLVSYQDVKCRTHRVAAVAAGGLDRGG